MSSSMGDYFRVTTFGESHGSGVGAVIDGCPPGLPLTETDIQSRLDRRRPGTGALVSPRNERDRVELLSGVHDGATLGSPIALLVRNEDTRPADYAGASGAPRPSHADFTYAMKYGRQPSGGGRASGRETAARVASGAVAEIFLKERRGVDIVAWISSIGAVDAPPVDPDTVRRDAVDASPCRCPDADAGAAMEAAIAAAAAERDSIGGVITCACRGVPVGWGEPVFGKLEALLAGAMLSIPATRGFELGLGFGSARLRGSAYNDAFVFENGRLRAATNHGGGTLGGISSGETVWFRVAFKPTPSIGAPQETADWNGDLVTLSIGGRHDPCVAIRAVPVVEAMAALVLADLALAQAARDALARGSGPRV